MDFFKNQIEKNKSREKPRAITKVEEHLQIKTNDVLLTHNSLSQI